MAHQNDRLTLIAVIVPDICHQIFTARRVETRSGLVQHQNLRLHRQNARQRDPALLTAGKLSETAFFQIADSQTIQIMDLDTGDKTQLGGQAGSVSRIFGFVGNDCIYGTGDSGDYLMSNGRVMGVYLKSIDIVDREMKSVMHYEKQVPGSARCL